jgi:glucose-1-phosphate thymidylyltransferase
MKGNISSRSDVVGLIPAGGRATRLSPIPCSKEIYPVGFGCIEGRVHPKVVSHYLLENMRVAGVARTYIVMRDGKWDIPAYFGGGSMLDMDLAYLLAGSSPGVPYTLDRAYPFVRQTVVAFGFPDILFDSETAFSDLLDRQETTNADAVLGLFPADRPSVMDMVDVDDDGRVRAIVIQPAQTNLSLSWDVAVWTPAFTEFLHNYLKCHKSAAAAHRELSVGGVIQAAIEHGLLVEGIQVSDAPYLDIGTPEGLMQALKRFSNLGVTAK